MKLTLDIDDSLLIRAKLQARRERISLSRLVEEALRLRLASLASRPGIGISAKLAERGLNEQDISDAVQWARQEPTDKTSRKK